MSPEEIEYYIIEESAKDVPLEHIQYTLEKDYQQNYDLNSLKTVKNKLMPKINIQREINERKKSQDIDDLIVMMKNSIKEMQDLITKMKNIDSLMADKTIIQAIQQVNALINTLLKATGTLKTQQEAHISNYYVKITQINEFFEKNLPSIFENLSPEAKKRLKEQLKVKV
jgi:oligoribonuclease NrnB/cAMP/cGMP phosphodiesterase (DHH superfamily)